MMSGTGESGWQRFKDWLDRQLRSASNPASAASSSAVERSEPAVAEPVATWEDEGGSPAGIVSSVPAPPTAPPR